jgi:hypothetical protein
MAAGHQQLFIMCASARQRERQQAHSCTWVGAQPQKNAGVHITNASKKSLPQSRTWGVAVYSGSDAVVRLHTSSSQQSARMSPAPWFTCIVERAVAAHILTATHWPCHIVPMLHLTHAICSSPSLPLEWCSRQHMQAAPLLLLPLPRQAACLPTGCVRDVHRTWSLSADAPPKR